MKKIQIKIVPDSDVMSPLECDGQWAIYSFSPRHVNFKHPDNFYPISIGLRRKLAVGLAFELDYYEHGECSWSLSGSGMQCRFDTANKAGLLIWEHAPGDMGAKTYADRAKDATNFLEVYTDWCNGHGLGYEIILIDVIELEDQYEDDLEIKLDDLDSCYGFYNSQSDYMLDEIANSVKHSLAKHGDIPVVMAKDDFSEYFSKVVDKCKAVAV